MTTERQRRIMQPRVSYLQAAEPDQALIDAAFDRLFALVLAKRQAHLNLTAKK